MKHSTFVLLCLFGCDADKVSIEVESRGDGLTTVSVCFLPQGALFCELAGDERASLLRGGDTVFLSPEPDGIIDFSDPLFLELDDDAFEGSLFDLSWSGFGIESTGFVTMPAPPEILSPTPGQQVSLSELEVQWAASEDSESTIDIKFEIECSNDNSRNLTERDLNDNGSYTKANRFLRDVTLDATGCPTDITISRINEGFVFDGQRQDSIRGVQIRTVSGVLLLP
jgi:hypothetical protein